MLELAGEDVAVDGLARGQHQRVADRHVREDDGDGLQVAQIDGAEAGGGIAGDDGGRIDAHLAAVGLLGVGRDDLVALHPFGILIGLLGEALRSGGAEHLDATGLQHLSGFVDIQSERDVVAEREAAGIQRRRCLRRRRGRRGILCVARGRHQ